jgi:hypothetical protein
MKKFILYLFVLTAFQLVSFNAISQTNYYGVSGNMVSGDFDNDGLLDDIAAFNTADELPALKLWTARNGWIEESEANCRLPFDFLSPKSLNSKIVAGDFDNDGFIDDIASIYEIGEDKTALTVWINQEGEFTPTRWWYGGDFNANKVTQTIVVGDFDKDGFVDDIAAFYDYDQSKTKVFVWKSDGKKFGWPETWWVGNDFNATRIQGTTVVGDFDHDGFKNDIAALYNYADDYCKIFVWTPNNNGFNWPYTWFKQDKFATGNAKNNVVAGDFNKNGYVDNIAALYRADEYASSILVFEKGDKGFETPNTWWYGNDEATTTQMRLVSADVNNNSKYDQITGLSISGNDAVLATWTAQNRSFTLPESNWTGVALSLEDCEENGGCLPNNLISSIKLYPNPNQGHFTVEIPKLVESNVDVTLYNVLGVQVMKLQAVSGQNLPIQMDNYKTGTYMLQITGKDFSVNQNFIVE